MTALQDQVDRAISAHAMWKARLATAIEAGSSEFDVATVRVDHVCEFGKWLHQGCDATTRAHPTHKKVVALHAEFHKVAAQVLGHALAGRKREAQELLNGPYAERSRNLVLAMMSWRQ